MDTPSILKKHLITILISVIFLIGLAIRLIYFENATFGYDQARDALVARHIFIDDPIKIQGPSSDIPGLFHGSLYWYLIAPFYLISQGDPQGPRVFLILLNLISVFFIFFFSKKLFRKTSVALISASIFAVSFEAVQYGRWLSNPGPALLSIATFYYGVWLALNKKSIGIGLMILGAAVSMQFEVFLVYLSLLFVIATVYYLTKNNIKTLFTRINALLATVAVLFYAPFLISEIKFRFQATQGLLGFFSKSGGEVYDLVFIFQKLNKFGESLITNVSYNILDFSHIVSTATIITIGIFILWVIVKQRKERGKMLFLTFWLLSPGFFYIFEKNNSYFLNIGNIYPLIMISALLINSIADRFTKNLRVPVILFFLGIIAISNLSLSVQNNKFGESLFSVQSNINLADEKEMVDWIYKESEGKPFAIDTVTNPLFLNTNWAYLFDWYGRNKHGYMPIWLGYPQVAVFGSDVKFSSEQLKAGTDHYLLIEPSTGIPHEYILAYRVYEHSRGTFITSRQFGEFNVEKRVLKKAEPFQRDDLVKYLPNQDTLIKPLH